MQNYTLNLDYKKLKHVNIKRRY